MDWAEVAQKLGFTVDRVRRKWSRIKNTGAVSEPLFAQLPFAQQHVLAPIQTKLSEEQISGHTISKTCQSLTLRVSERTRAQEERTRSPCMQGRLPVTNVCAHRELRRSVEIPNTQWALYPMGGGISAGGAVITAWFLPPPLLQLTLMPVTERYVPFFFLLAG